MKESSLGRSFKDLLEENERNISDGEEIVDLEIDNIKPNPEQPRRIFEENSLQELAESIKEHGIIQPVIVKPSSNGYILVAGERRVRATKLAGLNTIPAIVRDYNSRYLSELAILENLQREDLTPIEEALAFQKAISNLNLTHEELGKKIGKSRAYVTNIIGLLNLPTSVVKKVNSGKLSMGHARALSKLKDNDLCMKLADRIINENLTVREIEGVIRSLHSDKKYVVTKARLDKATSILSKKLAKEIRFTIKKNNIIFKFDSEEELDKIVEFLTRGE